MLYRIRQFFHGINATISSDDTNFINSYLTNEEQDLFYKLRISEQRHCLNVANGCKKDIPNKTWFIKAALLHDIGKIGSNLTLINKSFVVIAMALNLKENNMPSFLREALYYKQNHAKLGYNLLKNIVTDERVLCIIKNHHTPKDCQMPEIRTLVYFDDLY